MSYPRLVFKVPGSISRAGGTYDHECVNDEEEMNARLADGWFYSLTEAIAEKPVEAEAVKEELPPTREELEAKATELEIKFDGRTTDMKLGKMIAEKLAA